MMLFLKMFIDCLHKIDAFQMKHLGDINVPSGLGGKEDRLRSLSIQFKIPHPVPTRSCQRGYRTIMVIVCFFE